MSLIYAGTAGASGAVSYDGVGAAVPEPAADDVGRGAGKKTKLCSSAIRINSARRPTSAQKKNGKHQQAAARELRWAKLLTDVGLALSLSLVFLKPKI